MNDSNFLLGCYKGRKESVNGMMKKANLGMMAMRGSERRLRATGCTQVNAVVHDTPIRAFETKAMRFKLKDPI
ncbi:MAG: hypothetical protein KHZ77_05145 [Veillonella sp.]|uniref:hypothetical protein n=1 Tax=Veillonella sp. TaxID=1926307 RepID=UPI0025F5DBD1|nr:hypothetical protein [Veillonella sp.]MBS4913531.1 hypothetical protein [Veillonella sp.]